MNAKRYSKLFVANTLQAFSVIAACFFVVGIICANIFIVQKLVSNDILLVVITTALSAIEFSAVATFKEYKIKEKQNAHNP